MKNISVFFIILGISLILISHFSLERKLKIAQEKIVILETSNTQIKTALRFENLFLLTADSNDMLDFSMLEDMLCEKRGLCK